MDSTNFFMAPSIVLSDWFDHCCLVLFVDLPIVLSPGVPWCHPITGFCLGLDTVTITDNYTASIPYPRPVTDPSMMQDLIEGLVKLTLNSCYILYDQEKVKIMSRKFLSTYYGKHPKWELDTAMPSPIATVNDDTMSSPLAVTTTSFEVPNLFQTLQMICTNDLHKLFQQNAYHPDIFSVFVILITSLSNEHLS